ncbi:Cys/Met metabolism PLP-dependent enzyme-domain-containing protein [Thelephora terrestris]|uniref:cystathionine gamma-lyase n=1 Tax=Thelephora terrestris TaxID=56493 RepID=A0A9P6HMX2_9AGAM|nr:Cys/Met metabolism PLP-dependent enzyme-domain-containing protein [Thelephora terrestris]
MSPAPSYFDKPTGLTNGHSATNVTSFKLRHDGFGTRAIHVGSEPNSETGAVIPPISLATTYKQDGVGKHKGFEYSRSGNPNRNALESTLAAIEGGAFGLAFASGSATTATVITALGPDAHILSVNDVYGGTYRYIKRVAGENQGVTSSFVNLQDEDDAAILSAFQPNTKLVWIESPTNPTLRLVDIPRIVRLAKSHPSKPLVLVDNTFLSPFYSSPLLQGADIVYHSVTKYINGHSDVVMGALVLPARHTALAEKLRFLQNAIGAVPSAYDSWLAQRGLKTLHLRMKAHGTNALAVAKALQSSPYVEDVIYPGLPSHPQTALAYHSLSPHALKFVEQFREQYASIDDNSFPYSGMVSFRIRGGAEEADKFLTSTRLFTLAESLGGVESLAEVPAQMTHGSIPPAERELLGIGDNLIRLSVGVEETEDLVRDVEQALEATFST